MSGRLPGRSGWGRPFVPSEKIFIGLGSNLGDCRSNLQTALRLLEQKTGTGLTLSSFYRSEPVGVLDQPWFWNMAASFPARACGLLSRPHEILAVLKEIEREMGRVPTIRFGPRLIDLDLLFYKDWVLETCHLTVPHPRLTERSFVLLPLMELDPLLCHPGRQQTVSQLYQSNQHLFSHCEKTAGFF